MSQIILAPGINGTVVTVAADDQKRKLLAAAACLRPVTESLIRDEWLQLAAEVKSHLKQIEADREAVKTPFYRIGQEIDAAAKKHCLELNTELAHLNSGIAAFENERRMALQRAEQERRIEAQRVEDARRKAQAEAARAAQQETGAKALAAALDAEDAAQALEAKQADISRASHEAAIRAEAEKPKGGSLRRDWDILVTDAMELAKAYPQCLKWEPRLQAIKDLLNVGITPPGVKATEKVDFSTRAARPAIR